MPTDRTPQRPFVPWTEIAPTGSSILRASKKNTLSTTRMPPTPPITPTPHAEDARTPAYNCGRPRIHDRTGRGDRYQARQHPVAHHCSIGLETLGPEREHGKESTSEAREHRINDDVADTQVSAG